MKKLKRKTAIITGGGGALGGAIAEAFAIEGANIILIGRSQESLNEKLTAIQSLTGVEASAIACDVLDEKALLNAKGQILSDFGSIDILVNAAGGNQKGATISPNQTFFDLNIPDFEKVVDLNLMGTVLPCQVFGEVMANQKTGVILNVSSMAADRVLTRVMGYSASKAAMENFTKSLAIEMALKFGDAIRVNALAPGFFLAEQNMSLLYDEAGNLSERGSRIIENTPMNRFGKHEEIKGAAVFLCSDDAKFITGISLPIDGGFSAFSGV